MNNSTWLIWAASLIAQNFSFTFVSRARNSGSLGRHLVAAQFSNGIWFLTQAVTFAKLYKVMTGEYGFAMAAFTGLFYTVFTTAGSIAAHYLSLRTERGKAAVGASKRRAEILPEEWSDVKAFLKQLKFEKMEKEKN